MYCAKYRVGQRLETCMWFTHPQITVGMARHWHCTFAVFSETPCPQKQYFVTHPPSAFARPIVSFQPQALASMYAPVTLHRHLNADVLIAHKSAWNVAEGLCDYK